MDKSLATEDGKGTAPAFTYFNFQGRGELARLAFAVGNQKYHETAVPFEKWGELKGAPDQVWNTMGTGSLPVLQWGGLAITQSNAITQYVGARCMGADRLSAEQRAVDAMILGYHEDLLGMMYNIFLAGNDPDAVKQSKVQAFVAQAPKMLERLNAMVRPDSLVHGSSAALSLGDLALFDLWTSTTPTSLAAIAKETGVATDPEALSVKYGNLAGHAARVRAVGPETLKAYLADRGKSA